MTDYEKAAIRAAVKQARAIGELNRTPSIANAADAYANALGRANGMAQNIASDLEALLRRGHLEDDEVPTRFSP